MDKKCHGDEAEAGGEDGGWAHAGLSVLREH